MSVQAAFSFTTDMVAIVGSIRLTGFTEGKDVIQVRRKEPVSSSKAGADGNAVFAVSANKIHEIVFKFWDLSPVNQILQGYLDMIDNVFAIYTPIFIKDVRGFDLVTAPQALLTVAPDMNWGTENNEREWRFETNNPIVNRGGRPALLSS